MRNELVTPLGAALQELAEAQAAARDFNQSKQQFLNTQDGLRLQYQARLNDLGNEQSGEIQQQLFNIQAEQINLNIRELKVKRVPSENESSLPDEIGGFERLPGACRFEIRRLLRTSEGRNGVGQCAGAILGRQNSSLRARCDRIAWFPRVRSCVPAPCLNALFHVPGIFILDAEDGVRVVWLLTPVPVRQPILHF